MPAPILILAISGSLRAASSNTTLRAAARLAPKHVTVTLYDGLAELPHFNPDRDHIPARLVAGSLTVELGSNRIDEAAVLVAPTLATPIAAALAEFAAAIAVRPTTGD